jgi:hypothetical protein
MREERFLTPEHHAMLAISADLTGLLDQLLSTKHRRIPKPVNREDALPAPR